MQKVTPWKQNSNNTYSFSQFEVQILNTIFLSNITIFIHSQDRQLRDCWPKFAASEYNRFCVLHFFFSFSCFRKNPYFNHLDNEHGMTWTGLQNNKNRSSQRGLLRYRIDDSFRRPNNRFEKKLQKTPKLPPWHSICLQKILNFNVLTIFSTIFNEYFQSVFCLSGFYVLLAPSQVT